MKGHGCGLIKIGAEIFRGGIERSFLTYKKIAMAMNTTSKKHRTIRAATSPCGAALDVDGELSFRFQTSIVSTAMSY